MSDASKNEDRGDSTELDELADATGPDGEEAMNEMIEANGNADDAGDGHRLRTPPQERFGYPENHFKLAAAAAVLKKEHSGEHGHKQITLYKHGRTTVALFHFKANATLPRHTAHATVIIQCLSGAVGIQTPEDHHTLKDGEMLTLEPEIEHDLYAQKDSNVLLIVHLENGD